MKSIYTALVAGALLFALHCTLAKTFYKKTDIIDLKESEVREID